MKRINKKQILLVMLVVGLFILSGCQRNTNADGSTMAEKIIYLETPWKQMFENEDFFTALIVYPLSQAINFVSQYTGVALAVAIVAILYNVITLPLSIKSTVSSQKMQLLQPEMARIQEKYAGRNDQQAQLMQSQEIQQLYAKQGINPIGSLVTPFLQFPVLIAMYYAVQRANAVCTGTIFGIDLSTTPKTAFGNIATYWPIVVIFIFMVITQFLATKIPSWLAQNSRKKQKGYKAYAQKDDTASKTTNMMSYSMLAMVALIGLNWPTAMSVYWLINSVINVAKTTYIQKRYVDHE